MVVFGWGFGISFLGSLPPGVLNTGVTSLVVGRGVAAAAGFGFGAIFIEIGIVRVALAGVNWFRGKSRLQRWMSAGACGLLLLLAGLQFERAGQGAGGVFFPRRPWLAGAALSLVNPLHLPFWMGWTAVLRRKGVLGNAAMEAGLFSLAAGAGTALAFAIYALAGRFFIHWWQANQRWLNLALALVVFISGVQQLIKLLKIKMT